MTGEPPTTPGVQLQAQSRLQEQAVKEEIRNSTPRFGFKRQRTKGSPLFDSQGSPLQKNQLPHKIGYGSRIKPLFEPYSWNKRHGQWHQLPPLGDADR